MYKGFKQFIGKPPIHPFLFYTGKLACISLPGWFLVIWLDAHGGSISISMMILGLTILLISWAHLGKSTRIGLPETSTKLQTRGIYRLSRNPMYIALHIISIASLLYLMNSWAFILSLYCIIIHHRIILAEERFLSEHFTDDYHHYRQNVGRYL